MTCASCGVELNRKKQYNEYDRYLVDGGYYTNTVCGPCFIAHELRREGGYYAAYWMPGTLMAGA